MFADQITIIYNVDFSCLSVKPRLNGCLKPNSLLERGALELNKKNAAVPFRILSIDKIGRDRRIKRISIWQFIAVYCHLLYDLSPIRRR